MTETPNEPITLEALATRIDSLGAQMDWLCENLESLFSFVNQMGNNGGGIRGLMAMLKQGPPALNTQSEEVHAGQ